MYIMYNIYIYLYIIYLSICLSIYLSLSLYIYTWDDETRLALRIYLANDKSLLLIFVTMLFLLLG